MESVKKSHRKEANSVIRVCLFLIFIRQYYAHVMVNGHIVATGDGSMVDRINKEGYESFVAEP